MSNSTTIAFETTPEVSEEQEVPAVFSDNTEDLHPNFDYSTYENSFANRAKQVYICLQALMMTVYMVIGI